MNSRITILLESPYSPDAISLLDELSKCLETITGDGGRSSFNSEEVCNNRSIFVIARNQDGEAVGCGAFRPVDETKAEIKRMYAKEKGSGVGSRILGFLEQQALDMGYRVLYLETRLVNRSAVLFYLKNGYQKIPNYGKYQDRPECVCFEKTLPV